jgi:hypothetical protein
MKSASPRFQKRLGRKIKNYVDARWCHVRTSIVKEALVAKFEQNPPLMALLLKAEGCFVEASPYDKIWGIGLAANSPQARNRATWKGTNLLGCILDDVRADFIKKGWELNERGAAIQKS